MIKKRKRRRMPTMSRLDPMRRAAAEALKIEIDKFGEKNKQNTRVFDERERENLFLAIIQPRPII